METTAITAAVTAGIKINASSKPKFKFFNKLFNQQITKKELVTMERPLNKAKNHKLKAISAKQNKLASTALTLCIVTALAATIVSDASAETATAGAAVDIPFVANLKATVKELMTGAGSFVIDAMILAGGGWATARTSTPAPIILAILSVFIFEICVKLITQ